MIFRLRHNAFFPRKKPLAALYAVRGLYNTVNSQAAGFYSRTRKPLDTQNNAFLVRVIKVLSKEFCEALTR